MAMNVIIVASEAVPFSKTGGLADVAGSLPIALKALGCKPVLFLPYYRQVAESGMETEVTGLEVTVPMGKREVKGQVMRSSSSGVPVYFIRRDEYFDRTHLYGTPEGDYFDNIERFSFFSRAVLEALKARGFQPDIIHCNDWQTALVPAYLKDTYGNDLYYAKTATVFTVHNISYQGVFPRALYELTGLSQALFDPDGLEFWGQVNMLKAGLVFSDALTTVSRAYSREIQTPEHGWGLDGVLKKRASDLHGIPNGIDYHEWNPEADGFIPCRYSASDLSGKAGCRKELLKAFGLRLDPGTPLIGMVSRLAAQKGFDILSEAMPGIIGLGGPGGLGAGVVILGSGDRAYRLLIEGLAARYPERLSVKVAFDVKLSHLIEAGSDIFLMPSRFEPCGLNQIYSMRYGTIPVVRATGGLDDTVREFDGVDGTGFKFSEYSPDALVEAVKRALSVFKDRDAWRTIQRNAMREDFSWENSARSYLEVYRLARKGLHKT
jgi:starch synthase